MSNNKYELQIKTNYFKKGTQYGGNGIYGQYVEGCFTNGEDFIVYPTNGQFYIMVGQGEQLRVEDKERVVSEDIDLYHRDDETFFKYANVLIDRYKLKIA